MEGDLDCYSGYPDSNHPKMAKVILATIGCWGAWIGKDEK